MNDKARLTKYAWLILVVFFFSGCATVKSRKHEAITPSQKIAELERELQFKNEQIADLEAELQSKPNLSGYPDSFGVKSGANTHQVITVQGVTAIQLQKALKSAGFDPGSIDGRIGKQTVEAVKRFQKYHGLKADGVVGQKTWSLLKGKKR